MCAITDWLSIEQIDYPVKQTCNDICCKTTGYSSRKVVQSLSEPFRVGLSLNSGSEREAFLSILTFLGSLAPSLCPYSDNSFTHG